MALQMAYSNPFNPTGQAPNAYFRMLAFDYGFTEGIVPNPAAPFKATLNLGVWWSAAAWSAGLRRIDVVSRDLPDSAWMGILAQLPNVPGATPAALKLEYAIYLYLLTLPQFAGATLVP